MKNNYQTSFFLKSIVCLMFALWVTSSSTAQTPTPSNGILYVNKTVNGGNGSGDSWANAIPELADALKWARTEHDANNNWLQNDSLQIYVAKGTYLSLYNAADGQYTNNGNRENAFVMVKNVQLYGGFDPTNGVTNLTHTRDFSETTGSILSGDFNNDDVVTGSGASLSFSNNTENAHHILIAAGNLGNALLDGFSLIGGNADGTNPILVNGQDIWRYSGGGMHNRSSSPSLTNVSIANNTATNKGGGIYNYFFSSPSLTNVSIANNTASNGGGMYNYYSSPIINNSIVWGGTTDDNSSYTAKHSLIQGNSNTSNGNIDATGLSETDIFTDPANGDYSLKNGSPVINRGDNSLYTNAGGDLNNDIDLAGNPRLIGNTIDIGAFESQPIIISPDANNILYVDKNVTGGTQTGDSWANAIPELADALKWARAKHDANNNWLQNDSLQVFVAKGTYKPLYSPRDGANFADEGRDNTFLMVKNVQLYGGFDPANNITDLTHTRDFTSTTGSILSGDFNNDDVVTGSGASLNFTNNTENAYHVVISVKDVGNALLDGFSITNGNANGKKGNYTKVNGELIGPNSGGGMSNYSSSPSLIHVSIANNTADWAGGMRNYTFSSPSLTHVSITNNKADGEGGGIHNSSSSSPSLTNVSIANNTANKGDGMYNASSSSTINNSIVWGGIYGGNYTAKHSLIEGNSNTSNGNIDATGLSETDIFTDPANGDYSLKDGSPAINTGSNSLYTGDINNDTDLAGNPRLYDNMIDMGAFESQTPTIILTPDANNILYVDKNVTGGTQTGDSWANAIPELADALKWARTEHDANNNWLQNDSLQIYIAKGTYLPLYNAADGQYTNNGNRDNAFVMVKNVQLYGGFDPTNGVTNLSHTRDFTSTTGSILSGDFNNDDVVTGSGASLNFTNNTENAHHVVISVSDVGNALLNGFSITGGNANGGNHITVNGQIIWLHNGGGMHNHSSSPSLTHVSIANNTATNDGGGMYNQNNSSPSLTNVSIANNTAVDWGGGICNLNNSSPNLINVTITKNSADYGGGMDNTNSSPSLTNVSIANNTANYGGGMYNYSSSPIINNSIVLGGISNSSGSNYTAKHSLIQGNSDTANGNIDATGLSETDIFTDHANADYSLKDGSPAINTGSNSLYTGDLNNDTDLAGNPRLYDNMIDMGAFESQTPTIILTPDVNNILYVDKNVTGGTQAGDSWANAIPELADALKWARIQQDTDSSVFNTQALQIYVAKGTYLPLYNAADGQYTNNGNRDNAFVMVKNVQLYGGFDPTNGVTNLSHTRDFTSSTGSILSGDFNNDDVVTGSGASLNFTNNTENA
ncbi:hypothetical protein GGR32_001579, partial [Mesonia hippocampi]